MQEMIIPAGKAGLIIGKGGETIKQLQVSTAITSLEGRVGLAVDFGDFMFK